MVTKNYYYTIRHWGLDIVSASHPSGTAYKRKLPSQAVTTQKLKINSELGVSAHAQYPERNELNQPAIKTCYVFNTTITYKPVIKTGY